MTVPVRCPRCGAEGTLLRPREAFFCSGCQTLVARREPERAPRPRPASRHAALGVASAVCILLLLIPASRMLCGRPHQHDARQAAMAYIAVVTQNWDRRSWREFTDVATREHTQILEHPGMPARAIFSPYLQQARFERIEVRCGGASVDLRVWTGFKPTFIVPRLVTVELVQDGGRLKVAEVIGR
ncbi:MAG: hypothetical protein QN187_12270 [Armatimonadota bacterium]|nr:hypothetical protein [Armatimonadota bacterium]MDR7519917.1 hypothetical protein [Armatimonadota bacterium]MDR7548503.1 hypothetical protein [Armatimonadota bacterium]